MIRRALSLLSALVLCSGCLRYTPARSEISGIKTENGKNIATVSSESFRAYEEKQERRLNNLLKERAGTSQNFDEFYRIGPGDSLRFFVFDVPELNITVRVKQSGVISLPLLGDLKAAGLTETELQEIVTKGLKQYIKNPQVNLAVADYRAFKVSVLGEVSKPGTYALKRGDFTLIDVLSEAGGKTENAGTMIVLIPSNAQKVAALTGTPTDARGALKKEREKVEASRGIEIPYDRLIGSADEEPVIVPILPGDTVIIPEAGKVQIDGEVNQPGSFPLNSRMTLLGGIASAGGLTYSADVKSVEVIREMEPAKKSVLTVDLEKLVAGTDRDVYLRNGDLIRVPSHSGRFVTRQVIEGINSLVSFGVGGSVNVAK